MYIKSRIGIIACLCTFLLTNQAYALTGTWRGNLNLGQFKIPLVFNFSDDNSKTTHCTLDSPSQGAKGIPTVVSYCSIDSLSLTCNTIGASYDGKISPDSIKGTFHQRGYSFPLNLARETPIEYRRPQTPKPPFPYNITDTVFNTPDGAIMSATLTMPHSAGNKKFPVVLMVSGSGPQNRDEEIADHKPFAVIADFLARHGIGSLRYDDRGTGKSTGNFLKATTSTFKDDAHSGISFLQNLKSAGKIGVLGHSEGGTIAFMLGSEGLPDFIISLAGMAVSGKEILMDQNSHALDNAGLNSENKENALKLIGLVFDTMAEQERKGENTPIDIDSLLSRSGITANPQIISSLKAAQKMRTPWFNAFLNLNPKDFLAKIKCPLLAINGKNDTQVNGTSNLATIQKLVPQADCRLIPGLNHLLQHSTTGEIREYEEIRETISPEVLEIIADFINKL